VWEWELKWYRFFHANNRILAIGRIEKQPNTWHGTKARTKRLFRQITRHFALKPRFKALALPYPAPIRFTQCSPCGGLRATNLPTDIAIDTPL
jgi:hypothetical protein